MNHLCFNTNRSLQVSYLGLVPYSIAWQHQRSLVSERKLNSNLDDILLLLEHPSVYTLGQGASLEFVKFDLTQTEYELHRVERGGEVTYHYPGQLVGYPILNLRYYKQDLHWYLRQLEEVLIQTLAQLGVKGDRCSGMTGVWVEDYKVAAIGVKVSRWITMHGFALNIYPDPKGFERIVPCGLDRSVGCLQQFLPQIDHVQVRHAVIGSFTEVFQTQGVHLPDADRYAVERVALSPPKPQEAKTGLGRLL